MKGKTEALTALKDAEQRVKIMIQAAMLERETVLATAAADAKALEEDSLAAAREEQQRILAEAATHGNKTLHEPPEVKMVRAHAEKRRSAALEKVIATFEQQFL